jgi:hypothetical protein
MKKLNAYLVLGCNGHKDNSGFINCSAVENPIIDLSKLDDSINSKIINFLDNACGLFNDIIYDYNKCTNIISLLYKDFKAFDQAMLYNIQSFLKTHKLCGVYLVLILKENYKNGSEQPG